MVAGVYVTFKFKVREHQRASEWHVWSTVTSGDSANTDYEGTPIRWHIHFTGWALGSESCRYEKINRLTNGE
jgi:hypothetical protein